MPSKTREARLEQKSGQEAKLNQRLADLADRGYDTEKTGKDAKVRMLRAELRKTTDRLKAIDEKEKKREEMARKKADKKVYLYDTTLRDGAQAQGISFSLEDKILIAKKLDEFGIDYIEGGYPLSNPKEEEFFEEMSKEKFKSAKFAAFGMTRRKKADVAEDTGIHALLHSKAPVVTIVGKVDEYQIKSVLSTTVEENTKMIADSVAYCKKKR